MGQKLITFSLWGDDPKYCVGAIRNAELAERLYPDWICRFYVDYKTVASVESQFLSAKSNTEMIAMPEDMKGWMGMFARFLPASEDNVDVFISRDCDSRISEREVVMVNEWLDSPRLVHVIRDHPDHSAPLMGGLWGAKRGALPDLKDQIQAYVRGDFWQVDQNFLREIVWPANYHKVMAHDDWNRFPGAAINKFCPPREGDDFVGAIIGPNEERLHPEHHEMLS